MLRMELKKCFYGLFHRYVYFWVNNLIGKRSLEDEKQLLNAMEIKIYPLTTEKLLIRVPGKKDGHVELDLLPTRCR